MGGRSFPSSPDDPIRRDQKRWVLCDCLFREKPDRAHGRKAAAIRKLGRQRKTTTIESERSSVARRRIDLKGLAILPNVGRARDAEEVLTGWPRDLGLDIALIAEDGQLAFGRKAITTVACGRGVSVVYGELNGPR